MYMYVHVPTCMYMYLHASHGVKWLPVIALTGKAIFVGIGNSYRPMEKLIMKLNMT